MAFVDVLDHFAVRPKVNRERSYHLVGADELSQLAGEAFEVGKPVCSVSLGGRTSVDAGEKLAQLGM